MVSYALVRLASVALFIFSALAQTETIADAAGETVVVDVTLDAQGIPVTETLSTLTSDPDAAATTAATTSPLTPASLSSTALTTSPGLLTSPTTTTTTTPTSTSLQTAPTTSPDVQQGPVGAPPTTTGAAGPTVYTYTTTDGSGDTIAVIDTFTPSYPPTSSFTPVSTGSILNYSQWLSIIGSSAPSATDAVSGAAQAGAASSIRPAGSRAWAGVAVACLTGVLGGVWLIAV